MSNLSYKEWWIYQEYCESYITLGIPQGLIFGPYLSLISVNDLAGINNCTTNCGTSPDTSIRFNQTIQFIINKLLNLSSFFSNSGSQIHYSSIYF